MCVYGFSVVRFVCVDLGGVVGLGGYVGEVFDFV